MLTNFCLVCGNEIMTYPSWVKSGKSKYCSRECSMPITNKKLSQIGIGTRFKQGKLQIPWNKKGFWFSQARKNGKFYKLIHVPNHPFASKKGYVREHRLAMEKYLGRYLQKDEIVHHKDENTLNNDINNLELTNVSEHTSFHLKIRHQRRTTPLDVLNNS